MAKFIPDGWQMTEAGTRRYKELFNRVEPIIHKKVRKFNLQSLDPEDLAQEGRLAAAYAVDTFHPDRGNLMGYVSRVVSNALDMVACEHLAKRRQAYTHKLTDEGWVATPAFASDDVDVLAHPSARPDLELEEREERMKCQDIRRHVREHISNLEITEDAQHILNLRLRPPAELWITARNISGGRLHISRAAISKFLGWDKHRVHVAARELNQHVGVSVS